MENYSKEGGDKKMERAVIQRPALSVPIVLSADTNKPMPLLLRFAERPQISARPGQRGNTTYIGTSPGPQGPVDDYINDDA